MHHQRDWFPLIIIGLSLALIVVIVVVTGGRDARVTTSISSESEISAPTTEEYQSEVLSILSDFEAGGDAGQAYSELIEVRVPVEFKDMHLELVIAFGELRTGNTADGQARLDLLSSGNEWLR